MEVEYAKIEIHKKNYPKPLFYTGRIRNIGMGWTLIETEKKEVLYFRQEQIESVLEIKRSEHDENYY